MTSLDGPVMEGEVVVDLTLDELAVKANVAHGNALRAGQSMVQYAIECGEWLIQAKEKVKHGEWLPWLRENFDGSVDLAHKYMRLASNSERVLNMGEPSIRSALAAIAEPKVEPGPPVDPAPAEWQPPSVRPSHEPVDEAAVARMRDRFDKWANSHPKAEPISNFGWDEALLLEVEAVGRMLTWIAELSTKELKPETKAQARDGLENVMAAIREIQERLR